MTNTIAIASDHAGFEMKEMLKHEIRRLGHEVSDLGTDGVSPVDYPDYAHHLANWIERHENSRGVLICGSGIGMSIAANRHKGIRAALCHDETSAELSRKHNDANVLCLGSRIIGSDVAKDCLKMFLNTPFEGGRHAKRVEKLGG